MLRLNTIVLGVIALVGVVHLATLRAGHEWGDDFSLYVAHARNIAEGRAYADTGYIYNPHYPSLSPHSYPPIFPLLLAPVYAVFGLNLTAMKTTEVLIFLAFLWVLSLGLRRRLTPPYVAAVLLLVGLNPVVWQQKDQLLSETPFMLFAYLALYLLDRAYDEEDPSRRPWLWGLLGGIAAYLAFGTRTIGVAFLPTLLVYELLRRRRLSAVTLAAVAAFLMGVGLEKLLIPADASYLDQLVFDPLRYLRIGFSLVHTESWFVSNGYSAAVQGALYVGLLALACPAYAARWRGRLSVYEVFPVFYCLVLVFWPLAELNQRYLVPLLPLSFLYVAEGLQGMAAVPSLRPLRRPAIIVTAAALLASYAARYTTIETGPICQGVSAPPTVALFDYIKANSAPSDVFIFQKPRALALFTSRRASAIQRSGNDEDLQRYLIRSRAAFVVLCPQFESSRNVLRPLVERHPKAFEQVYTNPEFTIYRIRDGRLALR